MRSESERRTVARSCPGFARTSSVREHGTRGEGLPEEGASWANNVPLWPGIAGGVGFELRGSRCRVGQDAVQFRPGLLATGIGEPLQLA